MKKALFLLIALVCSMTISAQATKAHKGKATAKTHAVTKAAATPAGPRTVVANISRFYADAETRTTNGIKITSDSMSSIGRGLWSGNDGNSFTIEMADGSTITSIKLTCDVVTASNPEWKEEAPGYTWTGSAKSVKTGAMFENCTQIEITCVK